MKFCNHCIFSFTLGLRLKIFLRILCSSPVNNNTHGREAMA